MFQIKKDLSSVQTYTFFLNSFAGHRSEISNDEMIGSFINKKIEQNFVYTQFFDLMVFEYVEWNFVMVFVLNMSFKTNFN